MPSFTNSKGQTFHTGLAGTYQTNGNDPANSDDEDEGDSEQGIKIDLRDLDDMWG